MTMIAAKDEFSELTEEDVFLALQGADPENPIVLEVMRLIDGYKKAFFRETVRRLGHTPGAFLQVQPSCVVENVAMRLINETIRETLAERSDS
jgi:hypothetical protein